MTEESQKTLYLVAGPNGAGKSTFTQQKNIEAPVVDPDAIARGMNPSDPQQASVVADIDKDRVYAAAGKKLPQWISDAGVPVESIPYQAATAHHASGATALICA